MAQANPESIERTVEFQVNPEILFDAFTVPANVEQWFAQRVESEPRPGGSWTYDWPGFLQAKGRYLTIERPSLLVWTWDESIQDSRVGSVPEHAHPPVTMTYRFSPVDGGTQLHIVESGHESEEIANMNASGIDQMLVTLRAYVEDGTKVDWSATPKHE